LAALVAYSNSFKGAFVFDDRFSVAENPTIQHGWWNAWNTPTSGATPAGRPLVNITLALNYAIGGANVEGYHVLNLLIHVLASLTLFGVARRTLGGRLLRARYGGDATYLAFVIALLWTLHPLQTEAVTYINQRAESIAGLFYLLTLYGFIRATENGQSLTWFGVSAGACLLGMASKEVMMTAPLIVLLYDRTFVAGSFRQAWSQRRPYYNLLASTWALLALLIFDSNMRGGSVGFDAGMAWWAYALKQAEAIVRYLWLSFWPHPLVLDYGAAFVTNPFAVWPQMALVALLLLATLYALRRQATSGFLGAWFFLILAPSSSVVPILTETSAEHRMYLSLAAVIVLVVLALHQWAGRRSLMACLAMAVALGFITFARNRDYHSGTRIWSDIIAKNPENPRAHENLGIEFARDGRLREAVQMLENLLRIDPKQPEIEDNLGSALVALGQTEAALAHFRRAVELNPDNIVMRNDLGNALSATGHPQEAIAEFEAVVQRQPNALEALLNLGNAYAFSGHADEALPLYEHAVQLAPKNAMAHYGLGNTLLFLHRIEDAAGEYTTATQLKPDYAAAHLGRGNTFYFLNRYREAEDEFITALRLDPSLTDAQTGLDSARAKLENAGGQPPRP
jgi:tetratricopeptide (TPR) repeat protein